MGIGCVMGLFISGYSWNKFTLSDVSFYTIVSVFDVSALWPSHNMVSPYLTDHKKESSQVGGTVHGYNSRSVFYWKIGPRVEL